MLIAQLSDLHVRAEGEYHHGTVDSNQRLREAIAYLNGLDRRPDLVLLTGDLVDRGQPAEYAALVRLLAELAMPHLVLPGNHDDRDNLRAAFPGHRYLPAAGPLHYCIDEHPVRIVAIDSCIPGKDEGQVDAAALAWLEPVLGTDPEKPTIVMLHHPPFVSGIAYMDVHRCFGSEPLEALLAAHRNIEAVLCGHVHRPILRRWAGTVVCCCPSTATEFALRLAPDFPAAWSPGRPACMLHLWDPRGGLVSHTHFIGGSEGPFPFA
jgi:3',5'-cyclic AMP phosphodiesterase CpdA